MPSPAASVFVVDAFEDESAMYLEYLKTRGFLVRRFDGPEAALEAARQAAPDVIVTRLRQPRNMDGIEFVRRLRADLTNDRTRVIVITTSSAPADRVAAIAAGCDAFVPLPRLPQELAEDIEQVLKGQKGGA